MTRTSAPSPAAIPLPDRATTPSFRITSASASTPRPGSMTRPPRRQRSIRPGPLDRGSRGAESMGFSACSAAASRRSQASRTGTASRDRAVAHRAEAAVDLRARAVVFRFARQAATQVGSPGSSRGRRCTGRTTGRRTSPARPPARWCRPRRAPCPHSQEAAAAADADDLRVALARAPAGLGPGGAAIARLPCTRTRPSRRTRWIVVGRAALRRPCGRATAGDAAAAADDAPTASQAETRSDQLDDRRMERSIAIHIPAPTT